MQRLAVLANERRGRELYPDQKKQSLQCLIPAGNLQGRDRLDLTFPSSRRGGRRPESFRAHADRRNLSIAFHKIVLQRGSGAGCLRRHRRQVSRGARDNRWQRPAEVPLDRNGPTDVPFCILCRQISPNVPYLNGSRLRGRGANLPAATALVDRTDRLSYEAVQSRSLALAQHIQVTVPSAEARVAIWLALRNAQLPLLFSPALPQAETALVLNHRNPAGRIASIIEAARPAAVHSRRRLGR